MPQSRYRSGGFTPPFSGWRGKPAATFEIETEALPAAGNGLLARLSSKHHLHRRPRANPEDHRGVLTRIEIPRWVGESFPVGLLRVTDRHVDSAFLDLPLGFGV